MGTQLLSTTGGSMKEVMLVLPREGGSYSNSVILSLVATWMSKILVQMLPLGRIMLVVLMGTVLVTAPVMEMEELLLSEDLKCKGWEGRLSGGA